MWIPTQYVVLFTTILLLESAALFAYTLIGLIKQNPLPWLIPPHPDFSMCQYANRDSSQIVRGEPQSQGIAGISDQPDSVMLGQVQVVTSTSVILQTWTMMPAPTLPKSAQLGVQETIISSGNGMVAASPTNVSVTTVTASPSTSSATMTSTSSASPTTSVAASTSTSYSSSSSNADNPNSTQTIPPASTTTITSDVSSSTDAPSVTTITAGTSSSESSSQDRTITAASPTTQSDNVVTRQATLTSWVSASVPPRSTSTTLIVVPPP